MKRISLILVFFCFLLSFKTFCIDYNKIYKARIAKERQDTSKIKIYIDWHSELVNDNPQKSLQLLKEVYPLAKNTKFYFHKVLYSYIVTNIYIAKYESALNYSFELLEYCNQLKGDEKIDYYGRTYERMANIYAELKNIKLAILYQKKALFYYRQLIDISHSDKEYYYASKINLANYFMENEEIDKAISIYKEVEKKLISMKSFTYLSYVYNGLGSCYDKKRKINFALQNFEKSKDVIVKYTPEDQSSLAAAINNIARIQDSLGQYLSAVINYSEALNIFKKIGDRRSMIEMYYNLSLVYRNLKDFEKSNNYMLSHLQLKDSIFNEDTRQTIHEMSIKYESEKKEQQNEILEKENEKKQITLYFAGFAIVLIILILIIIYRNSRIKTKINKELENKNEIIQHQKLLVEEQHKEITDSIKYAERIQGAILPPDQKWQQILPNSFVLNKPKDILSGDFYWIAETEEQIFVAAADCTGHGVPGALISIVNFNLLNKAVLEKGLKQPNEILDAVNIWLTESLNQTIEESSIKDGMDISLVSINKLNGQVLFTGANNPIYHFTTTELIEVKGDKFPVGAFVNEQMQHFTTKEILPKFGDTIYLFSDGFADQFGGEHGKKYKYKQLKEKLFVAKELPIQKQKDFLEIEFRTWKGNYEQTDDVLIVGIRF